MSRSTVVSGNWKMFKTVPEATQFVKDLAPMLKDSQVKVSISVPFTAIFPAAMESQGTDIMVGAQNMHDANEGAFTGEIAASMLIDAGAKFVILGHSERRNAFSEDSAFINRKVHSALSLDLNVTLCVGETESEHKDGRREEVLRKQIEESLKGITAEQMPKIILAYEPVWAIGTGNPASPEVAQETHKLCRQIVADLFSDEVAQNLTIQYGGSVKPENAADLIAMPDIDGMLVGGASLEANVFYQIIEACNVKEYTS